MTIFEPFCKEFETIDQLWTFVVAFRDSGLVKNLEWDKVARRAWGVGDREEIELWLDSSDFED